jgi:murein L,D-transpeptidase YcbB/YkuD
MGIFKRKLSAVLTVFLCTTMTCGHASVFPTAIQALKQQIFRSSGDKQKTLLRFYEKNQYRPLWFDEQGWQERRTVAKEVLKDSDKEGLNPQEYGAALVSLDDSTPDLICQQEIMLTRQMLNYMDDLKGDRFDPRKIHRDIDFAPRNFDAAQSLYDLIQQDPQGQNLKSFTLNHPEYQKLKTYLATLRRAPAQATLPQIPGGKVLKKGMSDQRVIALKERLGIPSLTALFDETLEKELMKFQKSYGLALDGIVGERTLKALNRTPQDRINHVLATMEKWRWIPEDRGQRYMIVNIPSFQLYAYEKDHLALNMRVIIGQAYRHTPIFMSVVNDIRFNPSWYVPYSIAVKDKLKILKNNPAELSRKGFRIYDDSGRSFDPTAINWSQIPEGSFPYRLVQSPGSANALGKIRFNIPSRFNVYLHSTPDQSLFQKDVRTFSSGCIRLQHPDLLAQWILNSPQDWPLERIQKAMEGTQTRFLKLKHPIPVYITYFTLWFNDQGQPVFADDIYDQDQYLVQALKDVRYKGRIQD